MASRIFLFIIIALAILRTIGQNLDQLRASVTLEDQRSFIKISVLLDRPPRAVAQQLADAVPETHLRQSSVYNWYNDFKQGRRTDVSDLPKPGRQRTMTTDDNKEKVRQLILESEGMRTEDLIYETSLSKYALYTTLQEIGARKIKSRWVPHELTQRQIQARMNLAGKHLARFQRESGFLDKIIAIDETWLKSYDPEDSRQSSEWLLPGQKP
jgi:hypothetical protein